MVKSTHTRTILTESLDSSLTAKNHSWDILFTKKKKWLSLIFNKTCPSGNLLGCHIFTDVFHLLHPIIDTCVNVRESIFTLTNPITYVKSKINVFDVGINSILSPMATLTCCWSIHYVIELTRNTSRLLKKKRKKLCKISQLLVLSNLIWLENSTVEKITQLQDVTHFFRLKSVWFQVQILFQKSSFKDGVLDSLYFKFFATIVAHFFPN